MVLVTVTALGDLWSHQLTLSPMPVCPFYDKVVLAVIGCSAVGALMHCMYSVVALRQKPCATDLKKPWEGQGI